MIAIGNWNLSVTDVRKMLKANKGLILKVSNVDETLAKISEHSSRLYCQLDDKPDFKQSAFSASTEVASDCDHEDLYNGSEPSLDGEDDEHCNKRRKTDSDE